MGPLTILWNLKKSMPKQNPPSMPVRYVNSYIVKYENANKHFSTIFTISNHQFNIK